VTLFVAAVLATSIPGAAAAAAGSPSKLLASILAAARAQRSVHYESSANLGPIRVGFVGDAGVARGIQRVTYRNGTQTGRVTVIVSANTAYVRGDSFTLHNFMRFTATQAAKYEHVWILIPHTDRVFSPVAADVTFASTIDELSVSGRLSIVRGTKIDGQRVLGVRATKTSSSGQIRVDTLYARAAGAPLPVREVASQGTMQATATFSGWNERVHVAVPASPVPISVVRKTR